MHAAFCTFEKLFYTFKGNILQVITKSVSSNETLKFKHILTSVWHTCAHSQAHSRSLYRMRLTSTRVCEENENSRLLEWNSTLL